MTTPRTPTASACPAGRSVDVDPFGPGQGRAGGVPEGGRRAEQRGGPLVPGHVGFGPGRGRPRAGQPFQGERQGTWVPGAEGRRESVPVELLGVPSERGGRLGVAGGVEGVLGVH